MKFLDRRKVYCILIITILAIFLSLIILLPKRNIHPESEIKTADNLELLKSNIERTKNELKSSITEINKLEEIKTIKDSQLELLKSRITKSIEKLEFMESEISNLKISEEFVKKQKIKKLIEMSKVLETELTIITEGVNLEMMKTANKNFTTTDLYYIHEHLKSASNISHNILKLIKEMEM